MNVLIWGYHCDEWNCAINSSLSSLPNVSSVIQISSNSSIENMPLNVDIIIPLMECDILSVISNPKALTPSIEAIAIFADKLEFFKYAQLHNLIKYIPNTYTTNPNLYPCVLKRTNLNNSNQMYVCHTESDLQSNLNIVSPNPYVIQKYIKGKTEYVTHIVCVDGDIIYHISYETIHFEDYHLKCRQTPIKEMKTYSPSKKILNIFTKFLRPLKYTGPCNFNYKLDPDPIVFEINPRLGGSLMLESNRLDLCKILNSIINAIIKKNSYTRLKWLL